MKRIYSIILLLSFLVGTLQPILPMIEYQLHEGSVVKFLIGQEDNGDSICTTELNMECGCNATQAADDIKNLLNGNYYPIALQIATIPESIVYPNRISHYLPEINDVNSPYFLPIPPPPRLS